MKKHILLPALAWVGGIAGFALRRWELNTAYDPATRLMSVTAGGILLVLLMAALAAAFITACRRMPRLAAPDWFYAPASGYAMTALAGGLVMLIAGVLTLRQTYGDADRSILSLAASLLLIVGGATAAMAAPKMYRGAWSEGMPILLMGPAFGTLLWLVTVYQQHARQPEVQLYAWQLLSAVAIVLALYGQVTLALDKGGAGRTCVFGLLAIALTGAALADGVGLACTLVWLGSAVWLTAQSYMLLGAAFGPERPERMCPPEEAEQTEEETELEDTDNGQ